MGQKQKDTTRQTSSAARAVERLVEQVTDRDEPRTAQSEEASEADGDQTCDENA
jgi:hypothetical protein